MNDPRPADEDQSDGNQRIYEAIFKAITESRLKPGTHLKEDELGQVFGVGRTRVRTILARLAADHVIDLVANRGAFVAHPTMEEAREVFRARRLVEGHLVRRIAERPTPNLGTALEQHLAQESAARQAGDDSAVIRRCSHFHELLAGHADSPLLARFLRELSARSTLIVAVHGIRPAEEEEFEEHHRLVELILAGRAEEAGLLMERHLKGIEARLRFDGHRPAPTLSERLRAGGADAPSVSG